MRLLLIAAVLVGCAAEARERVTVTEAAAPARLVLRPIDRIDGQPATHLAVGGKLRIRLPVELAVTATAHGPFTVSMRGDVLVVAATGAGSGSIDLATTSGDARISVTAAPIAHVELVRDEPASSHATVILRDASGRRLVDASLRVAPGSAPITFDRQVWDRVELATMSTTDTVRVKTDLLAARPVRARDTCSWRDALADATSFAGSR